MELAGPLGTPLGLAQWKRASSRGEAGTSDFLSVSDSDIWVPAELGQESQATSFLRNGTPLASRVVLGVSGTEEPSGLQSTEEPGGLQSMGSLRVRHN